MDEPIPVDFIALDLETTGLDSILDRIVEIGAVRFDAQGRELATFESLVNPGRPCDPRAAAVHGITDAELALAPRPREVLEEFLRFLGPCESTILLAHNSSFDAGFLGAEFLRNDLIPPAAPLVDTLPLSRSAFPEFRTHRLDSVCRFLGIDRSDAHRALADCRRVKSLFLAVRERMGGLPSPMVSFPMNGSGAFSAAPSGWDEMVRAAREGIKVRIQYEGGSRGERPREITPRRFVNRAGLAYVVSYCHLDQREKEFRLDRVRRFELLEAVQILGGRSS